MWLQLLPHFLCISCMCPKQHNELTVYPHMNCCCGQDLFGRKGKLQPYVLCLVSRESKSSSDCELLVLKRSDRGAFDLCAWGGMCVYINLMHVVCMRARACKSESVTAFVCVCVSVHICIAHLHSLAQQHTYIPLLNCTHIFSCATTHIRSPTYTLISSVCRKGGTSRVAAICEVGCSCVQSLLQTNAETVTAVHRVCRRHV